MTDDDPNPAQRKLIDVTEGIHVVDAGPGTGKTYTITRRYANLLEQPGVEPDDVLLVTFTDNAATEMKERVVTHCEYSMSALRDAPIDTFHGFCNDLLRRYGFEAPTVLGIDDRITASVDILDNEVLETQRFEAFLAEFSDDHPGHRDFLRLISDQQGLLDLIKELASTGIFPTQNGWYRHGERYLDGEFDAFEAMFEEANAPVQGATGQNQSELRAALNGFDREYTHVPEAPTEAELREGYPGIDDAWAKRAFEEDRDQLKAFVHDIYFEYVRFALRRNYLNFSFLLLFAYVVLCEDREVREAVQFEYVMVDEFQDTSEIQFKLAALLAADDNLCVVGDWKQSIYGFQYADVDNIREFEARLRRYKTELNTGTDRITYPVEDVQSHTLTQNYRATQDLIEFSEHALTTPATQSEEVELDESITRLEATTDDDHTKIEAYTSDDEHEAILDRVQHIVDNEAYAIRKDGDLRPPSYDDIAVLTRTRRFGREFQTCAAEYDIPTAYEGGVELYSTDHAILLLAWLRILTGIHAERGWAVVLEHAGYTLPKVESLLDTTDYPADMLAFTAELAERETIGAIAYQVFERYGYDDAYADALVDVLQDTFDQTHHTTGDIVRFIERSHAADATVDVEDTPGGDALTVQTIHAAKGLEHPIVILANMNQYSFPPQGGSAPRIRYEDPIGLRQTKLVTDPHGHPHEYDNWRYQILSACLDRDYDEERRLLYVAITRAERHVVFTAGDSPSPLFENLPVDAEPIDPDVEPGGPRPTEQTRLQITIPEPEIPTDQSPHSMMDDSVFEAGDDGRGTEFGEDVHDFAEAYANGQAVEASNTDERNVKGLLDGLDGELTTEEHAYLPMTVDGRNVSISGIIDLLHITDDHIDIIDYKTDLTRRAEDEYRKQLSVYYHVVTDQFPDRDVSAGLFYTKDDERVDIDPLTISELAQFVTTNQSRTERTPAAEDRTW